MNEDLQKRIAEAMRNPQNMGELPGADAVGTVGNSDCGEMLRMSLATELIRGKTPEEALALKTEELAGELGPLPPMKIHCAQLVEGALRSALEPETANLAPAKTSPTASSLTLLDSFTKPKQGGTKISFLPGNESSHGN